MFLGTFSKIFCPGLRLGWIAAEHSLLSEFVKIKQSADLHTSNFDQGVADAYMEQYDLDEHVKEIVALYKHRRDLILESMEKYFPAGTEWTHPEGGLFLWLTFPEGVSARKVFNKCIEMKVAALSVMPSIRIRRLTAACVSTTPTCRMTALLKVSNVWLKQSKSACNSFTA